MLSLTWRAASRIRPSSSVRIRFECRLMTSRINRRSTWSPSSSTVSISTWITRSPPTWRTPRIRPPMSCLRRSMQKAGGSSGFANGEAVRWQRALFGEAESSKRRFSFPARTRRMTMSFSGWVTLSIRPPVSRAFSSRAAKPRVRPSMGIGFHSPSSTK